MIFFTVIMLIIELIILVNPKMFKATLKLVVEDDIKKARLGDVYKPDTEMLVKMLFLVAFAGVVILLDLIYLTLAFNYDPYLYPTLALLLIYIINIVKAAIKSKKKKPDLTTEEGVREYRAKTDAYKGRSFISTMIVLIWIAYYVYMLYFLIG